MGSLISQTAIAQTPIRELQRHSGVTISGTVKSVVGNEFTLNDGTGEIIIRITSLWLMVTMPEAYIICFVDICWQQRVIKLNHFHHSPCLFPLWAKSGEQGRQKDMMVI
jgi:uncharacterized protein YdeI (BOF family)